MDTVIILLLGEKLRHRRFSDSPELTQLVIGGNALAPAVYLLSPASDRSAPLPLDPRCHHGPVPSSTHPPGPLHFPCAPHPSLLTAQLGGPLFRDALLDTDSVGILFLYYFPVGVEMALHLPSLHSLASGPVSTSYLEPPEGRGHAFFLGVGPPRAQHDLRESSLS